MTVDLIKLMQFDEWDLNQDERDAIKAIILERDGLKAENERLRDVLTDAIGHVSHDDNCPGGEDCNCDYSDWQNKAREAMSKRHPTVGGNLKPAGDAPPIARKKKIVVPQVKLVCACGVSHVLYLTEGTLPHKSRDLLRQIIIPCQCGALLRYYAGRCTIEEVEL